MGSKVIMLVDMESFYASVEVAANPFLRGKPVAVCGDPERRHGVILAATREAKAWGVKTGMTAGECARLNPSIIFVKPHMQKYVDTSARITQLLYRFTDRVVPYSIDEQFLDITGCEKIFGPPEKIATAIIKSIWQETKIRCRVGIGQNPLQAKMACDCFAKKNTWGIFRLDHQNYTALTWPLPVRKLFGIGSRMESNLLRIGVRTIGNLASLPRETLKKRWGINGEVLWLNSWGIDHSQIKPGAVPPKGVGCSMTLPRDYRRREEIDIVLLEITEEVCRRARVMGKIGMVVKVYCRGADFSCPTGFSRQKKMPEPTAFTLDVYPWALDIFYTHWDRKPVRTLGITLSDLISDGRMQLSLVEDKEKKAALNHIMDKIRQQFGPTSLFRLSSLGSGSQLIARANKIGGHEA